MNLFRNILIALSLIIVMNSCSKDDDPIPLADPGVSASDFDSGHLGIKMEGNISSNSGNQIDSIVYINVTKGFDFMVDPSLIIFPQTDPNGTIGGRLSQALLNGNTGDEISCCIYVNTPITVGVVFSDTDTFVTSPVSAGTICYTGTY